MLHSGDRAGPADRYEIIRHLGSGGVCHAYLAKDHSNLGANVAIKCIQDHLVGSPELSARMQREFSIQANISHRNVVKVVELTSDAQGSPLIVMEFIDGMPLDFAIQTLRPDQIVSALVQALVAVNAINRSVPDQSAVHRDLSPQNLLIEHGTDRLVVADFGLARRASDPPIPGSSQGWGTPGIYPPEAATEFSKEDIRSDVFQVGRSFMTSVTGIEPLHVTVADLGSHWHAPILRKMTEPGANNRYQSADECIQDLLSTTAQTIRFDGGVLAPHIREGNADFPLAYWSHILHQVMAERPLTANHLEIAMQLARHNELALLPNHGETFENLDSGPVQVEFGRGGAAFSRCDPLVDLYTAFYSRLGEAERLTALQRLLQVAADYNRFRAMYALRNLVGAEQSAAVKDAIYAYYQTDQGRFQNVRFPDPR